MARKRAKGKRRDEDEDEEADAPAAREVSFGTEREIAAVLAQNIPSCSDAGFFSALAAHMARPLNHKFQASAMISSESVVMCNRQWWRRPSSRARTGTSSASCLTASRTSSGALMTYLHEWLTRVSTVHGNMRLFARGIEELKDADCMHLIRHLLKTLGTTLVNIVHALQVCGAIDAAWLSAAQASAHYIPVADAATLSAEQRAKVYSSIMFDGCSRAADRQAGAEAGGQAGAAGGTVGRQGGGAVHGGRGRCRGDVRSHAQEARQEEGQVRWRVLCSQ